MTLFKYIDEAPSDSRDIRALYEIAYQLKRIADIEETNLGLRGITK